MSDQYDEIIKHVERSHMSMVYGRPLLNNTSMMLMLDVRQLNIFNWPQSMKPMVVITNTDICSKFKVIDENIGVVMHANSDSKDILECVKEQVIKDIHHDCGIELLIIQHLYLRSIIYKLVVSKYPDIVLTTGCEYDTIKKMDYKLNNVEIQIPTMNELLGD